MMVDEDRVKSRKYAEQVQRCDPSGSHPDIVAFYRKFQKELAKRGYPFFAHEFLRDNKRQAALKAQGVSNAGAGRSPHNYGCAVDIIHSKHGWNITRKEWAMIGQIGKEVARKMNLPIVWGGDYKSLYDPAHWELENWRAYRGQAKVYRRNKGQTDGQYFRHLARMGNQKIRLDSALAKAA